MSLYGEEKCAQLVEDITEAAIEAVRDLDRDGFLSELARRMAVRRG